MRFSIMFSIFERTFILSLGGEIQRNEPEELEHHDLTAHHELSTMGFQPNEEWEDDDE